MWHKRATARPGPGWWGEPPSRPNKTARRISKNLRWNTKYAYTHYDDYASGGRYNYESNLIFTSLQYRF